MNKNKVTCTLEGQDYLATANTPDHRFNIDEPIAVGGGNTAPNPTEYLLSALASCTAITMKMYAQRKGWDPGKITVEAELKNVLGEKGAHPKITKTVSFEKPLEEKQMERVLRVGDKCPVAKLIKEAVAMDMVEKS